MNNYDPYHDKEVNLELSQEGLGLLHRALSYALILHGEVEDNPGTYIPDTARERVASRFHSSLPTHLVREIFCKDEPDVRPKSDAYASYEPPHFIEEDDRLYDSVHVQYEVQIVNSDLSRLTSILLQKIDETYVAEVDIEYYQDGKLVSPENLALMEAVDLDDLTHDELDSLMKLLRDRELLTRPLTIDDAGKLRELEVSLLRY